MPVPDLGLAPPPPPDVSAQLRPSGGPAGLPTPPAGGPAPAPNLQQILAMLGGGQAPQLSPDLTPKILAVEPLLSQLASQVPALGPDVDRLNVELQARMGGLPNALASMASPFSPGAPSPGLDAGAPGATPSAGGPIGGLPAAPAPIPLQNQPMGAPAPMPPVPQNPTSQMGAMDTAMQIEMQLPPIGKDDPTLMPYIQGFIARMRDEVPKVVSGETETTNPPPQAAPTESMLSKIPTSY